MRGRKLTDKTNSQSGVSMETILLFLYFISFKVKEIYLFWQECS